MLDVETVTERLRAFGYEAGETDIFSLTFCVDKVRGTIKNLTHLKQVPAELEHVAVDMAAGEFLQAKKTFSPDALAGLDLGVAVKQIQQGDTNTVFAVGEGSQTPEQRLSALIAYLLSYGRAEINSFRRLKW